MAKCPHRIPHPVCVRAHIPNFYTASLVNTRIGQPYQTTTLDTPQRPHRTPPRAIAPHPFERRHMLPETLTRAPEHRHTLPKSRPIFFSTAKSVHFSVCLPRMSSPHACSTLNIGTERPHLTTALHSHTARHVNPLHYRQSSHRLPTRRTQTATQLRIGRPHDTSASPSNVRTDACMTHPLHAVPPH